MFKEGTERPFTSDLLKENERFLYCANCGNKLFASTANLIVELAGLLFLKLPGAFKTKDYSFVWKE